MNLGSTDTCLLFGGGRLMTEFASIVKPSHRVVAVTGPRYATEEIEPGVDLVTALERHGVETLVTMELSNPAVLSLVGPTTLGVSFGAPWIFRRDFIDRFHGRLLNVHGARLPYDRGAGGFSWRILRQDRLGCCLVHQVAPGLDTGPIVSYREFTFPAACRIPRDYIEANDNENRTFLAEFAQQIRAGHNFEPAPQLEYLSNYWPRLSTLHHGFIDWDWNAADIEWFACAFDEPYAGASTFSGDARFYFKDVFLDLSAGSFHPFQAGLVFRVSGGNVFVAARGGAVVVRRVIGEDGMDCTSGIRPGRRFYTPRTTLDAARQTRAVYSPTGLTTDNRA